MTLMVQARALAKTFGHTQVLRDVNLDVARGECVGVLGARHSGRSTLLRILATLVPPSSGRVEIDGVDAVANPLHIRSRLAYASAEAVPQCGFRVRDYARFVLDARSPAHGHASRTAIDEAMARAQLPADAPLETATTGVRSRLALAVALLLRPELLLLDDPLRDVEAGSRQEWIVWMREARDAGTTLVVAIGDDGELAPLCHRVDTLDSGRLTRGAERITMAPAPQPAAGVAADRT